MNGREFKQLREDIGSAIGRALTVAEMARLCGLPPADTDTIRRWEVTGPSDAVAELLRVLAMASDQHPILDKFNVFDRHDVRAQDRPARRAEFREKMRDEVRRRLA